LAGGPAAREALYQQVAKRLLMSVLPVGRHAMVEPEEWPDELPVAVVAGGRVLALR